MDMTNNLMVSDVQKLIINLAIILAILLSFFILLFDGFSLIKDALNIEAEYSPFIVRAILFFSLALYLTRFLININKREIFFTLFLDWKFSKLFDFLTKFTLFVVFPIGISIIGSFMNIIFDIKDIVAAILFLVGMSISVISEYQRTKWKANPINKGKLYQKGLFRFARNVNYFGESITIPSLLYVASGSALIFVIFLIMQLADFIIIHIPKKERYLQKKYGEEFIKYSKRTKKIIPFVY